MTYGVLACLTFDRSEQRSHRNGGETDGTPRSTRTTSDRRLCALDAGLRHAPLARRVQLDRHHRRPDRPRRDDRRQPEGRVRNPRLRHAEGDRPDRDRVRVRARRRPEHRLRGPAGRAAGYPRAEAGSRGGGRDAQGCRVQADRGRGGDRERQRSVRPRPVLGRRADRLCGGPVRPGHLREGPRGGRGRRRRRPRGGRAGGRRGGVQRRRRVPPDRAGHAGATWPARGADRAPGRLPHVRRDVHPDRTGAGGAGDGVPAPVHPRRPDRHQHDHAAARVDDRPRSRDRLLAVHRHALQTAAARRPLSARRGRRGGCIGGPGGALRRHDGCDLGHRSRLLRPRLRHEARNRLGARRPDHGADRELAPDRGAPAARAQGRPAEGAVPASDRRLRGGPRPDARRPLGTVRDREREGRLHRRPAGDPRARVDLRARPPGRGRPGDAAGEADGTPRLRPAGRGLRPGLQRPDPDRRRRQLRPRGPRADLRGRAWARR